MSRVDWTRGQPIPPRYSGMTVTFQWNEVALDNLLRVLKEGYPSGYASMVDHIREAMRNYTPPKPPKPDEPAGLGAVVEDAEGRRYTRYDSADAQPWWWDGAGLTAPVVRRYYWDDFDAVRVLSEGVQS